MTEPTTTSATITSATTSSRPPLFTMQKTVGPVKKGTRVTPIDEGQLVRGRLVYQVVLESERTREAPTSYPVPAEAMERIFRTGEERELGRDFTPEEAEAHERTRELRFATMSEQRARLALAEQFEEIARTLDRQADDARKVAARIREHAEGQYTTVAELARWQQGALLGTVGNLHLDTVTYGVIEWANASHDLARLERADEA